MERDTAADVHKTSTFEGDVGLWMVQLRFLERGVKSSKDYSHSVSLFSPGYFLASHFTPAAKNGTAEKDPRTSQNLRMCSKSFILLGISRGRRSFSRHQSSHENTRYPQAGTTCHAWVTVYPGRSFGLSESSSV